MEDLTLEAIQKAYREASSISPQIMWRMDRERCSQMDREAGRGYLIINPELDLGGMDVNGCIVKNDGLEYRVVISDTLKGARKKDADGNETSEPIPGYWLAAPPSLEEALANPSINLKVTV